MGILISILMQLKMYTIYVMGLVQKGWNTIEVMTEKYEENGDLMW